MDRLPSTAADVADHLLATDPYLCALTDELWRWQRRLRRAAGLEAFRAYLRVEELTNERLFALVERIWALARTHDPSSRHPQAALLGGVAVRPVPAARVKRRA
jgi:hypothetical protein